MDGHEKSLLGKQARLAGEPLAQDEYVAETDMVSRLFANPRHPITTDRPTVVNRVWERNVRGILFSPYIPKLTIGSINLGSLRSLHNITG